MDLEVRGNCSLCGGETYVTRYQCTQCLSSIEGEFRLNKFSKLTDEQLHMVELFLLHRGNMKEMEKALGISYPTVRNKLEDIVEALGHKVKKGEVDREDILRQLANKEITTNEAVELLRYH